MTSTALPPSPPNSSGKGSASRPRSAYRAQASAEYPSGERASVAAPLEIIIAGNAAPQGFLQRQLFLGIAEIHRLLLKDPTSFAR